MMAIPSFDLKRNYARVEGEIKEALDRVLESQHFILGPEVAAFEKEAAAYLDVPHAVGVASGSDSLLLALMTAGVGPGDEVITTPFSFFATASCITRLGAKPVFADVEPDSYNISMERVREVITPATKALIPVHLFGQLCRVEQIKETIDENGIALVEDCAQAFGAHRTVKGRIVRAGGCGGYGCFSFFPTKNLAAYGDAGMTTCFGDREAEELSRLRVHGASTTYKHDEVGLNSRLDAMQAAILRVRLRHIETWTEERREAARRYGLLFAEYGVLEFITPPAETPGNRHTYHQYVVRARRRDDLQKFLAGREITTRVYYPLPLHMQPCFESAGYKKGDMPVSESLCGDVLALPMFPELQPEEQECVVAAIAEFCGSAS
ncbi:MAG: DegT/DnrJ/EryC1/StrS family aminotransferase [Synergistaceae bacterium]|jgi:dTDP-4-amino-4,6-dideoxygalactose transaminase|nr:DegT/DnrJ/EryC1/StrS family aminotransferase [Synergistaceae bacterium]